MTADSKTTGNNLTIICEKTAQTSGWSGNTVTFP